MTDLLPIPIDDAPQGQLTEAVYQLDEDIVKRLSRGNTQLALSQNTQKAYRDSVRDYNRFLAEHSLAVNQQSLQLYFEDLKTKLKPSSLNLRKSALLKCIQVLIGEDSVLKRLAIERVFGSIDTYTLDHSVDSDECLTEDQVRILLSAAQSEKTRLLVLFLYKTACRVSELCGIRLSDCAPVGPYIKIRVVGKGNKERDVYVPPRLYGEVRNEYNGQTWLFESKGDKPLHPDNVANQIRTAGRRAGLGNVTPHMLRHSRATDLLLRKGQSLKAVSRYLGHQSVNTTAGMYIHDQVDVSEIFGLDTI